MNMEEIAQVFFVECEESLAAAEDGLAACQQGEQDADTVNGIFRAVHSIKGGAGAFGYIALQGYTHVYETLLSDVRDETLPLTDELVDLLLRALDTLSDHVSAAQNGDEPPDDTALLKELTAAQAGNAENADNADAAEGAPAGDAESDAENAAEGDDLDLDSMLDDLAGIGEPETAEDSAAQEASEAKDEGKQWPVHIRPHADAMRHGSEPLLMLRELEKLGGTCTHCDTSSLPALDEMAFDQGYLGWTFAMPDSVEQDAVREIFEFIGEGCSIAFGEDAAIPPCQTDGAPTAPLAPASDAAPKPDTSKDSGADAKAYADTPARPVKDADAGAADTKSAAKPAPAANDGAAAAASQSIRIDLAKLDQLIASVGELVIAQAMLAQRLHGDGFAASEELSMLDGLTRDIQESAMSIRAQPISSVFRRVPRILRELASTTNKHVKLELNGETTELDKTVIERLGEPLTHLIRNAVDHGIESAEDRLAAGKPAEGVLTLSAEHRSGRIHIQIADDGRGINKDKVFASAVQKQIIPADANLSDDEINALIFAPGFSTAENITNVSGRGVGMDVVRKNVKDLGGRITIESEPGTGTTFTLILPLTLAISDGMIVQVKDQTMVVPLASVVESMRPSPEDVKSMGTNQHMLNVRGEFIPVVPLCQSLQNDYGKVEVDGGVVVIVETEAWGQVALLVDAICDQRQFVIKSLDTHYREIDGISGATILGDGQIALILDVDGIAAGVLASKERVAA